MSLTRKKGWKADMLRLKHSMREFLAYAPINRMMLSGADILPGQVWKRRIPPALPHVLLKVSESQSVLLSDPLRCSVAKEIYWGGGQLQRPQDRNALSAAITLAKSASTFLDIGAYTGIFALAAARVNPRLQAYAYEIVGQNFDLLCQNVLLNELDEQVHPCLTAIAHERGEIRIPHAPSLGQLATSVDISGTFGDGARIPMQRLDDLHLDLRGPVVVKIDVEGFEMNVLDGGAAILEKHQPDIVCEVLRRSPRVPEMMETLRNLGYRWLHIQEGGYARRNKIVADKLRRDWLLTCKNDSDLDALGLNVID